MGGETGGMSSSIPYSIRSSRRSIRILPRRRNSSKVSPDWFVFELRVSLLATREREIEREGLCVICRSTRVDFRSLIVRKNLVGNVLSLQCLGEGGIVKRMCLM